MRSDSFVVTLDRQIRSRFRSVRFATGLLVPSALIGVLLWLTARATDDPATTMFLAILASLWTGGSACVREIVDERAIVRREPHLKLLAYGASKLAHAAIVAAVQAAITTAFVAASGVTKIGVGELWMILALTAASGAFLALILSALCDEAATALAWFPLLLVPQVVFGGFLFPFGDTRPFAVDDASKQIVEMPAPLIRTPVKGALELAGRLATSRWALESYAAFALDENLSEEPHLHEAIQASFFLPITLAEAEPHDALAKFVVARATGRTNAPPDLGMPIARYVLLLLAFPVIEALLLICLLPLRDPRAG